MDTQTVMKAKLYDANGKGNAKMFIEGDDSSVNMPSSFVLANRPKCKKSSKARDFITGNPNVGRGSSGFASVITLASIITVAGAIIAFLSLRY